MFFVNKYDLLSQKELNSRSFKSNIISVDTKGTDCFLKRFNNNYFLTETNRENLTFVLEISNCPGVNEASIVAAQNDIDY